MVANCFASFFYSLLFFLHLLYYINIHICYFFLFLFFLLEDRNFIDKENYM